MIKKILKRNKYIHSFVIKWRSSLYFIKHVLLSNFIFNLKKILRVSRINKNSPYEKLKSVKNKHNGERCFIVATGPSLTIADLEKLRNEVTFGMNSICLAFDETDWRPTYYGIQDEDVYMKLKEHIDQLNVNDQLNVKGKFISDTILNQLGIQVADDFYIFPMNMLNHNMEHKKYHTKFSDDAFAVVYNGYSITYSLIQIAVYMGFKEIYLLGVDCNYSSNMKHHFKDYGLVDSNFSLHGMKMISGYKEAKKYADKYHVKIYNATRGGMLEVFERVDFDELLSESHLKDTVG